MGRLTGMSPLVERPHINRSLFPPPPTSETSAVNFFLYVPDTAATARRPPKEIIDLCEAV